MHDIRKVYTLIEEVAERGSNARAWREHMLTRLCQITGSRIGITVDLKDALPGLMPKPVDYIDVGFPSEKARARLFEYMTSSELGTDPGTIALLEGQKDKLMLTATRQEMVDAPTWYASPLVSEARRSAEIDHFLVSSVRLNQTGHTSGFILYKEWGGQPFEDRHKRIVRLFHIELLRRIFPKVPSTIPNPNSLPSHLRKVLACLLAGQSNKEAAETLSLSPHTVKDYTKELHHRANVSSRGELLATYLNNPAGRPIFLPDYLT